MVRSFGAQKDVLTMLFDWLEPPAIGIELGLFSQVARVEAHVTEPCHFDTASHVTRASGVRMAFTTPSCGSTYPKPSPSAATLVTSSCGLYPSSSRAEVRSHWFCGLLAVP